MDIHCPATATLNIPSTSTLEEEADILDLVSQGYNRGNVMVLEDPSFSPSFSFDDFIYYAILNSPIDAEFLP